MKASDNLDLARHQARRLQVRMLRAFWLRSWLLVAAGCCFLYGGVMLVLRLLGVQAGWHLPCLLFVALLGLAGLPVWFWCRRRVPPLEKLLSWLDASNSCGGLLTVSPEELSGNWSIPSLPAVRLHVDFRREAVSFAVGLAFCLLALFLPARVGASIGPERLDVTQEVKELEAELEMLEEEKLLEVEKIAELRENLQNTLEEGIASEASKTYEILDLLANRLETAEEKARNSLADSALNLEKLAELLEAIEENMGPDAAAELGRLLSELAATDPGMAEVMQKLAEQNPGLASDVQECMAGQQRLSKQQQKELAEAVRKNAARIREKLKQMAEKASQNGQSSCSSGNCSGVTDAKSLEDWLNSNAPGSLSLKRAAGCPGNTGPDDGQGGASRGPGHAPLNFSAQPKNFEPAFRDQALQGQAVPDDSRKAIQHVLTAPSIGKDDQEKARSGKLQSSEAHTQNREKPVHPQHRKAVEEFFK